MNFFGDLNVLNTNFFDNFIIFFQFSELLPDAIKTGCSKCNEQQKKGAGKVFRYLKQQKPAVYEKLMEIYDPKKMYKTHWETLSKA